jgi:pimeloyl-ACP methyl ester carboxylesterase
MWRPALAELSKIDPRRRVLSVNLPGHGRSVRWPSYDVEGIAEGVHRAAEEARLRSPVVVGHSIGAVNATAYAARYPASGGQRGPVAGADPQPSSEEIDHALWQACHGGQRRTAEYLYARGGHINAIPDHSKHTPLDIAPGPDTRKEGVVSWLRARQIRDGAVGGRPVGPAVDRRAARVRPPPKPNSCSHLGG